MRPMKVPMRTAPNELFSAGTAERAAVEAMAVTLTDMFLRRASRVTARYVCESESEAGATCMRASQTNLNSVPGACGSPHVVLRPCRQDPGIKEHPVESSLTMEYLSSPVAPKPHSWLGPRCGSWSSNPATDDFLRHCV